MPMWQFLELDPWDSFDVNEQRLDFAKDYCATEVHAAIPKNSGEDNMSYSKRHVSLLEAGCNGLHSIDSSQAFEIMKKFGLGERGEGIDLVVECSGAEVCVQTGIWLAKRRGMFVQVGAGPANNLIPMSILVNKEVTVKGSLRVRVIRNFAQILLGGQTLTISSMGLVATS
ncbi:hypothetical protein KNSL1_009241 [Colletotrichum chrysophilum]|nr:hypothetical protein KNSL1_009241 [Colletotrichum chrysophilum]